MYPSTGAAETANALLVAITLISNRDRSFFVIFFIAIARFRMILSWIESETYGKFFLQRFWAISLFSVGIIIKIFLRSNDQKVITHI